MELKTCTRCESTLPLSDFYRQKRKLDGHSSWCIPCHKEYWHQYKTDNRKAVSQYNRRLKARYRAEWDAILESRYKVECSRCGYSGSRVALDFHHPSGRSDKTKKFSYYYRTKPTAEKLAELDSCIILCSNCHRIIHSEA